MFAAFLVLFGTPVLITIVSFLAFMYVSPLLGVAVAILSTFIGGVCIAVRIYKNYLR